MGVVLLEVPLGLIAVGVALDEVEDFEIVLGIADDASEILEIKQAQITLVILPGLLEQVLVSLFIERVGTRFFRGVCGFLHLRLIVG